METAEAAPTRPTAPGRLRRASRELALVAVLFLAYKLGRLAVVDRADTALDNGELIWRVERLLRLPDEAAVQGPVLVHALLAYLANGYYAYVHFPATAACLVWLFLRRPAHYRWTRKALALLTAAALVLHLAVPLAPPRLTPLTGMVDTGRRYGPAVYGPPDTDALSNQYAAMPSLHLGWALAVAVALVAATAGRLRWLWLAHPLVTMVVVVVTGNHYWLDGVVAAVMLALILLALSRPAPVTALGGVPEPGRVPTPEPGSVPEPGRVPTPEPGSDPVPDSGSGPPRLPAQRAPERVAPDLTAAGDR
ncbi:phosphatase PAP2 family protein [Micromonospora okii]|uniref:phosphatase PAP2 family protein n=1 Tax=Micromonospora okii TaxID=1182970 RepID=UPI001E379D9F|nr:phosphatase PAP2 family protein [Micromonospora okii]